ncbi:DUF2783 domain-containing protein [Aquabacterium sp. A08]|uniref:DUF2783 domain-containing protein n=1 Tax=Aquabacterium sp. A08 TaxID=2718532 RepID=UPI0014245DDF|nr:DUF2783 domain-containing protein [Aquabacterium sp. A08]NIC40735.1 DUF2783 domain-containing protein [Aquabacterium sp. A08]
MLNTQAHALPYDDMYEALIAAHQGLSTEQSHALNARLVLLLANHIGDVAVLREAFRLARHSAAPDAGDAPASATAERQAITPVVPSHAAA